MKMNNWTLDWKGTACLAGRRLYSAPICNKAHHFFLKSFSQSQELTVTVRPVTQSHISQSLNRHQSWKTKKIVSIFILINCNVFNLDELRAWELMTKLHLRNSDNTKMVKSDGFILKKDVFFAYISSEKWQRETNKECRAISMGLFFLDLKVFFLLLLSHLIVDNPGSIAGWVIPKTQKKKKSYLTHIP